jgi:SAM-dependent methyltransferase
MPNTLAHIGVQTVLSRSLVRGADLRWIFAGCVVPDVPWIANRAAYAFTAGLDPLVWRSYWIAQASLAGSLLLCAALAALARRPLYAFALLAGNAAGHLLLDALQTKWGNGVHLLAPFSWQIWNAGWFWPESPVTVVLTALGLAVGLWALWRVVRLPPAPGLARLSSRRLSLAALFAALYVTLPLAWRADVIASDSHSLRTLAERQARAGRAVAFDRTWLEHSADGARIVRGDEVLKATGTLPEESGRISARGRFVDPGTVSIEAFHPHGWPRAPASYLGLLLVAAVWLGRLASPRRGSSGTLTRPRRLVRLVRPGAWRPGVDQMGDIDSTQEAVRRYWDAHPLGMQYVTDRSIEVGSPEFFEHVRPWMNPYKFPWIMERIEREASLLRGKHLLEIGCGMGFDSVEFLRRGVRVTAIDLTPTAVTLARRHFELLGLEPEDVRVDSALDLSFPDESFDAVWSNGVLHATGDTRRAVAEVRRVLAPGGRAIISHFYRRPSWMYLLHRLGRENIEHPDEDPPVNEFRTEREIESFFEGFEIVEVAREHHRALPVRREGLKALFYRYAFRPAYNLLPERLALALAYKYSVTAVKR